MTDPEVWHPEPATRNKVDREEFERYAATPPEASEIAQIKAWHPEPKPVPPELTDEFDSATFTDPPETPGERMAGVPIEARLDEAMRQRVHDFIGKLL